MYTNHFKKWLLTGLLGLAFVSRAFATVSPMWTFATVQGYPPLVSIGLNGTATIKYIVTNNSPRTNDLFMTPIQGIDASGCNVKVGPGQSCTLTLVVNGSELSGDVFGGPVLCDMHNPNQCYRPLKNDTLHIVRVSVAITPSLTTLALSINCLPASSCTSTKNAALTGNTRFVTIKNTGNDTVSNLQITKSGFPPGTKIDATRTTCTDTLNPKDSCIIAIKPGAYASSYCTSGTIPTPGKLKVTADLGLSSEIMIYVLGYGCQYQGGYLYAIDDTYSAEYPLSVSIGGKVVSLVDQAKPLIASQEGVVWSSNGNGNSYINGYSYDKIPYIAEDNGPSYEDAQYYFDTTYSNTDMHPFPDENAFSKCVGKVDGQCNTQNILALYRSYKTGYDIDTTPPYTLESGPTDPDFYAAGRCSKYSVNSLGQSPCTNGICYNNWYLPAICEMDNSDTNCSGGGQSMVGNLSFLLGDPAAQTPSTSCHPPSGTECLVGYYWSSTEYPGYPQGFAWGENVVSSGPSFRGSNSKGARLGVRCSRALTR